MKWLSAGVTFVNCSTVCGLILGMATNGLALWVAVASLTLGAVAAIFAYLRTSDPETKLDILDSAEPEAKLSKRAQRRLRRAGNLPSAPAAICKYRHFWTWVLAACFTIFALRSFCWLLYIDGNQLKIQSPNNLGDLALHITYIRNFANGVSIWPDNPIYVFSKLRYPAGIDLFNALLCYLHFDLTRGLVWTGLLASLATFYAFYRWGGAFGVAGFLFNGGVAGFQILNSSTFLKFLDYQGDKTIAWKSIPLSMFVTQRGLLYAIPAGLLLLWHWREKFFRTPAQGRYRGPLPFWVELSLYASMPLFHVHTFLALSAVLVFLFGLESFNQLKLIVDAVRRDGIAGIRSSILEFLNQLKLTVDLVRKEGISGMRSLLTYMARWGELFGDTRMRKHLTLLLASALVPATLFVWLITDHFHAKSVLEWHPGWVQDDDDFAAPFFQIGPSNFTAAIPLFGWLMLKTWNGVIAPFFQFWITNFGAWIPLVLALIGLCGWRVWKSDWRWGKKLPEDLAFLLPAVAIFVFAFFVKTAPWGWDNLKIMIWAYFLVLPFLWTHLIARWSMPVRVAICVTLFGSGFVSLLGGLAAGQNGFGFADRAELDGVGDAVRKLPAEARFAAYPIYNHPLLLQGRKVVLGYPGHLWTEGFDSGPQQKRIYAYTQEQLRELMEGAGDWRETARHLRVRYLFWGREEKINYPMSGRPWEKTIAPVASGIWGAIYDLEEPMKQ